jgi:enterochelin esterase-like enzyme
MHTFTKMLLIFFALTVHGFAAELELVRVSDDGKGFVLANSDKRFVPWGFNYDHEGDGKLLEDYWDEKWPTVESAFREMKELGANVVRIHLQFGTFMESPTQTRQHSLNQLARLVKLAERTGLYLDLTGLGCYHKHDVPPWYDSLNEQERWRAQATFWEAVAKTCADSPAIFCYDLMNEPVVPGGEKKRDDWLGPAFAGKHFVQFITLEAKGRPRHEIARKWISHLVTAIRKHDTRHLITVGLVPWSLDRPGLTSGFVPEKIANDLDFIAMHLYPETGKQADALETLKGFAAVGKPVVIEEIFPLKDSPQKVAEFIERSQSHASGWIRFYWGKTANEYRQSGKLQDAIVAKWLETFVELGRFMTIAPARRGQGVLIHDVDSAFQSGRTEIKVLLPDQIEEGKTFAVLYILPVEAENVRRFGDSIEEVRKHDLHNTHGLICVFPTFSDLPWYADHPTNTQIRQETYFLKVVVPFIERTYPVKSKPSGRLLVGFSKSGWGAWSLILRHPDTFGKAAAWDAPLMMEKPNRYGMGPIFGTQQNFEKYSISSLLEKRAKLLSNSDRLLLMGHSNFKTHHDDAHNLLQRLSIRHIYREGPKREHSWESGWLPEVVELLVSGMDGSKNHRD